MKRELASNVVVALGFLHGCSTPESQFRLADESRPPKWCVKVSGEDPGRISATIAYYVAETRYAVIQCMPERGRSKSIRVSVPGLEPLALGNADETRSATAYEVLVLDGDEEVVRHLQGNNRYWMVDDPNVLAAVHARRTAR